MIGWNRSRKDLFPPCKGCTREQKRPGCHDSCEFYIAWRIMLPKEINADQGYIDAQKRNCERAQKRIGKFKDKWRFSK